MEEVIIVVGVSKKLDNLIDILFEKEYFGFYDSAAKYVRDIYRFISNVPNYATGKQEIQNTVPTIADTR